MFTIPCVIGDITFQKAMLDSGASINVIPYSIYKSLKLGELHETGVVIQLADHSKAFPKGILEDVLVKVGEFVFPTDFYVLDMEHDEHAVPILLGRPFLKTARTKIDVHKGSLTMEFDEDVLEFNIYNSMKLPSDDHSCYSIDIIDSYSQDTFDVEGKDDPHVTLEHDLRGDEIKFVLSVDNVQEIDKDLEEHFKLPIFPLHEEPIQLTITRENLVPSIL